MYSIKVVLQDEVRRVQVSQDCGNEGSFVALQETLRNIFPALRNTQFLLTWQDEEGETISASSDGELFEALQVLAGGEVLPRFTVKIIETTSSESEDAPVIHHGVTCDECGVSPIRGVRFQCTIRPDFDLCSTCESRQAQPYPMTKITESVHGNGCPRFGGRWGGPGGRGGCHGRGGGRGFHGGRGPFGFGPFGLGSAPEGPHHGFFGHPGHHGPHGGHHHHGEHVPFGHSFQAPPPPPPSHGLFGSLFGGRGFHQPPPSYGPPHGHHAPHVHGLFGHGGHHGHHHGHRGGRGGCGWGGPKHHHGPYTFGGFQEDPFFASDFSGGIEDPLLAELSKYTSDPNVTVTAEVLPPFDAGFRARRGCCGRGRFRELCRDWRDRAHVAAAAENANKADAVTTVVPEAIVTPTAASDDTDGVIVTAPEAVVVEVVSPSVEEEEVQILSEPAPTEPSHDEWVVLWGHELAVLASMGFVDTHVLVPLLQTHIGLDNKSGHMQNGSPNASHMDGMQRVMAELLGQMGVVF